MGNISDLAWGLNDADEAGYNVDANAGSNASTPKNYKEVMPTPIFEEVEFGQSGTGPKVQQSAFVRQIETQNK